MSQPQPHESDGARYFVAYQDDGPAGPCAQDMAVTQPWNRLYVFDKPKDMLDFIHDVKVETHRVNARVTGYWASGDDHYPLVADWTGQDPATAARRMRGESLDSYVDR